jgi:hypothetical protein
MTLPKEKKKVDFSMSNLSALIYGIPKVGKSTFCSNAPDALFIATEAGLNHIECYSQNISNWMDFLSVCHDLSESDEHGFKTVIIDTVDNLYQFCSDHVLKMWSAKTGKQIDHETDMDYGKGFALVRAEFLRVMTKLSQCPFGLILTSHAVDKELDTRTGKIARTAPSMSNQCAKVVSPIVDLILYFELNKDQERVIHCHPHTNYEAGDRTGRLPATLPMEWSALADALQTPTEEEKPKKKGSKK